MQAAQITRTRRSTELSGDHYVELKISLTGTFVPGYPERGPSYDCGGEPAEPDGVEDVEIVALCGMIADHSKPFRSPGYWRDVDLLDGVDRNSPDVRRLLENLTAFIGEDAETALLGAA